jgi:hypothetical protein
MFRETKLLEKLRELAAEILGARQSAPVVVIF